jgi:uroporphyrinogen decarboxylase
MLAACRGEPVDRPPVWLMRQAGRYLPEYREIRARTPFLELCADAAQACEVSLQPWRRFGVDAIVVFSDILLPLTALDLSLDFDPGPVVADPIRGTDDLARLDGDVAGAMAPTCEAIRRIARETKGEQAVIGFAGAPWTLAAYALEERLSRDTVAITALSYADPDGLQRLLARMAEITAETLALQIEAGADALQIFDTWAGMLAPDRFRSLAGRALGRVLELLPERRPPVILYARGATHLVDELAALRPDVVSLDWRVDLAEAAGRIGRDVSLQGNLDPAALQQAPAAIERDVARLIEQGRKARGHVVNLGHGIQPHTPIEGVAAFVRAVQAS